MGLVSVKFVSRSDQNKAQGYKGVFDFRKGRSSKTCVLVAIFLLQTAKRHVETTIAVQKFPENRHKV